MVATNKKIQRELHVVTKLFDIAISDFDVRNLLTVTGCLTLTKLVVRAYSHQGKVEANAKKETKKTAKTIFTSAFASV